LLYFKRAVRALSSGATISSKRAGDAHLQSSRHERVEKQLQTTMENNKELDSSLDHEEPSI
jgi:hypothetical protein